MDKRRVDTGMDSNEWFGRGATSERIANSLNRTFRKLPGSRNDSSPRSPHSSDSPPS